MMVFCAWEVALVGVASPLTWSILQFCPRVILHRRSSWTTFIVMVHIKAEEPLSMNSEQVVIGSSVPVAPLRAWFHSVLSVAKPVPNSTFPRWLTFHLTAWNQPLHSHTVASIVSGPGTSKREERNWKDMELSSLAWLQEPFTLKPLSRWIAVPSQTLSADLSACAATSVAWDLIRDQTS